jgi:hypothetical protein
MILGKKDIVIIVLCILLLIVGYIAYQPEPINGYDAILTAEVNRLNGLNEQAVALIQERDAKIDKFTLQIDSLQKLKPKIQIEYVSKYKEINDANANSVANEFKRIFANAGIK